MAIGITPGESFLYVLKDERTKPVEKQTRWRIRYLSSREQNRLISNIDPKTDPEWQFAVARVGLIGWENLRSVDGGLVEFFGQPAEVAGVKCDNAPSIELLDRIGMRLVSELAEIVLKPVTEEELGNS